MKLILTQEVSGLGGPGEIVEVKDGYGRNYLVPRGFAIVATKGAEKQVATIKRAREVREVHDLGQAQDLASQLQSLDVKLPMRSGAGGRLFGAVTASDVVDAVKSSGGPALDKRRVHIETPIKSLGTHTVGVRVHAEVDAKITVEVVSA